MVGQEDLLAGSGKQACGFGHEEHAAEDDVAGFDIGDAAGQLKGVAHDVHMLHHFVGLIMMAEDDEVGAVLLADGFDAGGDAVLIHVLSLKSIPCPKAGSVFVMPCRAPSSWRSRQRGRNG